MNARIRYHATKDGEYRVIATSFEPNQTGKFQLIVKEADLQSGPVEVLKAIKLPAPGIPKMLELSKKGQVQLTVCGLVVDAKGDPQTNKKYKLAWAQLKGKGEDTVTTDNEGFFLWPIKSDRVKGLRLEFKGQRAALIVSDEDGNNYRSARAGRSVHRGRQRRENRQKQFGTIGKTDPFDIERDKCFRHVHEFKMQAGKTYTLDMVSEDVDSYLRIEHDDQGKLAEDDDGAGMMNSRIVFTPEADGTFRLVATTCDPGQLGVYRLTIRETNAKAAPKKDEKKVEKK